MFLELCSKSACRTGSEGNLMDCKKSSSKCGSKVITYLDCTAIAGCAYVGKEQSRKLLHRIEAGISATRNSFERVLVQIDNRLYNSICYMRDYMFFCCIFLWHLFCCAKLVRERPRLVS